MHRRAKNYNEVNYVWETVTEKMSLKKLKELYLEINGKSFDPKKEEPPLKHSIYTLLVNPKTGKGTIIDIGS